jgi:mono/diheme cytochrome c family protein
MTQGSVSLRNTSLVIAVFAVSLAQAQSAGPSASEPAPSTGFSFSEKTGEQLFSGVCRGCHMTDGKGAVGAGTYPSLAGNRNLEASGYPIYIIVNGRRGMPPLGSMMSNEQVAAVVNYLRTHFGNNYRDEVVADDVKVMRR